MEDEEGIKAHLKGLQGQADDSEVPVVIWKGICSKDQEEIN